MYTKLLSKTLIVAALVSGTALTVIGGAGKHAADLTGGGVTLLDQSADVMPDMAFDELHGAATVLQEYKFAVAAWQMTLGIFLILFGFFLHAFLVSRGERRVRVTEVPRHVKRGQWYWMEMKV